MIMQGHNRGIDYQEITVYRILPPAATPAGTNSENSLRVLDVISQDTD